jgi:SOS-response transcriptional repressor LexA/DNA-binding XRE family transcriptional regulator
MRKSVSKMQSQVKPDWAVTISKLRTHMQISQTDFGRKLHASAMAISRWERGAQEPTAQGYIALGNLAGDPLCWNFWQRAGLGHDDFMRVVPSLRKRLIKASIQQIDVASAGSGNKKKISKSEHIAVPLLKIVAAAHGGEGDISELHDAEAEGVIAAPKEWCPNPSMTTCLRVKGDSMAPVICDGYIIAVDSSQNDRSQLHGKIVIAWNKEKGLTVTRFSRFEHAEVLQPENNTYESIVLNNSHKWKILGKVLWWVGQQS